MIQASILAEGNLKTTGETFQVRNLSLTDLQAIQQLQSKVKASLDHSDYLQPLSTEEFEYILSGYGFMIGTFVKDVLIAFRAMMVPESDNTEHLGLKTGLTKKDFPKMIHSEISVVHPDYRGNDLQQYMGNLVMENVDKSQFRYVAATVAPFNIASLKDKLALGMKIIALIDTYNGKMRYVLFRDLLTNDKYTPDEETVDMSETETQQHLLANGYRGVAIQGYKGSYTVTYQRVSF